MSDFNLLREIAAGATGAGGISGFRGSLFGGGPIRRPPLTDDSVTLSPYATKTKPKKKRKMKKSIKLVKEGLDFDQVTTAGLKDLMRSQQKQRELRDTTELFAIEDEEGGIVKVYVARDQAEEFKQTVERMLADDGAEGKEVAEIIYDLHKSFDLISVDWGKGTIPEDEEQPTNDDPISNAAEADEEGYPDEQNASGDVEADVQGEEPETGDVEDMEAGLDDVAPADGGNGQLLSQIVQLLKSQVDAQRAAAEAEKAKADVAASAAAAEAAQQYANHQEEVMDMENFVKRQREDKRENQIQAKLMRYRHDLRKDKNAELQDKLKDPDYLLNTLHKISIGESMTTNVDVTPPTPEEEEILHMEDWEAKQKDQKKNMKLRDRLMRYRHANKSDAPEEEVVQSEEKPSAESGSIGSLRDFIMRNTGSQE